MAHSASTPNTSKTASKSKPKATKKGPPQTPKTIKPWDQRKAKKGDDSEKTLLAAIGRALSSWTNLEMNFANLFSALCNTTTQHTDVAVRLAFGSNRTFEGRAAMLDAVQKWFFRVEKAKSSNLPHTVYGFKAVEELETRVLKLFKDANNYVARRNELAHGKVSAHPLAKVSKNKFIHLKKPRFLFRPAYMELTKHDNFVEPKFEYSAVELADYTTAFEAMASEAISITLVIRHLQRARHEATPEQKAE